MKCRVHVSFVIVGLGVLLLSGCSYSRGSQVSRASETGQKMADDLADDDELVQTASAETPAEGDDGPPSQPGVKPAGGSRKKLSGWLSKGKSKSGAIPLNRTDKSQSAESETAEEDSGWWQHQDAPATAQNASSGKDKDANSLSLSSTNPFDN